MSWRAAPAPVPRRVLDQDGTTSRAGWPSKCRYMSHTTRATKSVSRWRTDVRDAAPHDQSRNARAQRASPSECRTMAPRVNHADRGRDGCRRRSDTIGRPRVGCAGRGPAVRPGEHPSWWGTYCPAVEKLRQLLRTTWKCLLTLRMVAWSPVLVVTVIVWWVVRWWFRRRRESSAEVRHPLQGW
jgi:hypothetical protein